MRAEPRAPEDVAFGGDPYEEQARGVELVFRELVPATPAPLDTVGQEELAKDGETRVVLVVVPVFAIGIAFAFTG